MRNVNGGVGVYVWCMFGNVIASQTTYEQYIILYIVCCVLSAYILYKHILLLLYLSHVVSHLISCLHFVLPPFLTEMPNMTGPEATRVLRSQGCTIPIIGITGNVLAVDVENFKAAGANEVLAKPLRRERLQDVLTTVQEGVQYM